MEFAYPEDELAIQCARLQIDPAYAPRVQELIWQNLDWDRFWTVVTFHKLGPIIFNSLSKLPPSSVPAQLMSDLRLRTMDNLGLNLWLRRELLQVLELFQANNIQVIPFKGPVLAEFVYRDLALRGSGDLDVLLHKDDVLKAKQLLFAAGYQPPYPMTPKEEAQHFKSHYHYLLYNPAKKVSLELHWALTRKDLLELSNPNNFWNNTQTERLNNVDLIIPTPEIFVIFACAHGFKHQWRKAFWLYDIVQIIRTYPDMNWEGVLETAGHLHTRLILLYGLYLANSVFGCPLPEAVTCALETTPVVERFGRNMQFGLTEADFQKTAFDDFLSQYFLRESAGDRVRFLLSKAQPNANEDDLPIPANFSVLRYAARFPRLLVQYLVPWFKRRLTPGKTNPPG